MIPVWGNIDELSDRIGKATDILLESMSIYEADKMRKRVIDAFYLLLEGKERGA